MTPVRGETNDARLVWGDWWDDGVLGLASRDSCFRSNRAAVSANLSSFLDSRLSVSMSEMSMNVADSPPRPRTMREYDEALTQYRTENFQLKLHIYFLEERMQKMQHTLNLSSDVKEILNHNIQLQMDVESLKRNMADRENALRKCERSLENSKEERAIERQNAIRFEKERLDFMERIHQLEQMVESLQDEKQKQGRYQERDSMALCRLAFPALDSFSQIENQSMLEESRARVQEMESHISSLESKLGQHLNRIQELEGFVSEKDAKIAEVTCSVVELKKSIEVHERNDLKRDKSIQGLLKAFHGRSKEVKKLQETLNQKEKELSDLQHAAYPPPDDHNETAASPTVSEIAGYSKSRPFTCEELVTLHQVNRSLKQELEDKEKEIQSITAQLARCRKMLEKAGISSKEEFKDITSPIRKGDSTMVNGAWSNQLDVIYGPLSSMELSTSASFGTARGPLSSTSCGSFLVSGRSGRTVAYLSAPSSPITTAAPVEAKMPDEDMLEQEAESRQELLSIVKKQAADIAVLQSYLSQSHAACDLLRDRLEELSDFLQRLLIFDGNGELDLSQITPRKVHALREQIAVSRDLSNSLSQSLMVLSDKSLWNNTTLNHTDMSCPPMSPKTNKEPTVPTVDETADFSRITDLLSPDCDVSDKRNKDVCSADDFLLILNSERRATHQMSGLRECSLLDGTIPSQLLTLEVHEEDPKFWDPEHIRQQETTTLLDCGKGWSQSDVTDSAAMRDNSFTLTAGEEEVACPVPEGFLKPFASEDLDLARKPSLQELSRMLEHRNSTHGSHRHSGRQQRCGASHSDSDSWSEPDRNVSLQRIGLSATQDIEQDTLLRTPKKDEKMIAHRSPRSGSQHGRSPRYSRYGAKREAACPSDASSEHSSQTEAHDASARVYTPRSLNLGASPTARPNRRETVNVIRLQARLRTQNELNRSLRAEVLAYQRLYGSHTFYSETAADSLSEIKQNPSNIPECRRFSSVSEGGNVGTKAWGEGLQQLDDGSVPGLVQTLESQLHEVTVLRQQLEKSVLDYNQLREELQQHLQLPNQNQAIHHELYLSQQDTIALQEQIEEKDETLARMRDSVGHLQAEVSKLEKMMECKQVHVDRVGKENQEMKKLLDTAIQHYVGNENELKKLKEELEQQLQGWNAERAQLNAVMEEAMKLKEKHIEELEAIVTATREERDSVMEELRQKLGEKEEVVRCLEARISRLEEDCDRLLHDTIRSGDIINRLKEEITQLSSEKVEAIQRRETAMSEAVKEKQFLKEGLEKTVQQVETLKQQLVETEAAAEQVEKQLAEQRLEMLALEEKIKLVSDEKIQLEMAMKEMEVHCDDTSKESKDLQNELRAKCEELLYIQQDVDTMKQQAEGKEKELKLALKTVQEENEKLTSYANEAQQIVQQMVRECVLNSDSMDLIEQLREVRTCISIKNEDFERLEHKNHSLEERVKQLMDGTSQQTVVSRQHAAIKALREELQHAKVTIDEQNETLRLQREQAASEAEKTDTAVLELQREVKQISDELNAAQTLSHSLQAELSLFKRLEVKMRKVHDSRNESGSGTSVECITELLNQELVKEIRTLREQLERSTEANVALREALQETSLSKCSPHEPTKNKKRLQLQLATLISPQDCVATLVDPDSAVGSVVSGMQSEPEWPHPREEPISSGFDSEPTAQKTTTPGYLTPGFPIGDVSVHGAPRSVPASAIRKAESVSPTSHYHTFHDFGSRQKAIPIFQDSTIPEKSAETPNSGSVYAVSQVKMYKEACRYLQHAIHDIRKSKGETTQEMNTDWNAVYKYVNATRSALKQFRLTLLPCTYILDNSEDNVKWLQEENGRLNGELLRCQDELQDIRQRSEQLKQRQERAIAKQLTKTHQVLQQARQNLTENEKKEKTSAAPSVRSRMKENVPST